MSDDTIRLVTIGRIIRRRRRLLTLLTVVGALVGYGLSLLFPPQYTASASVLLPGAWEQRELLTQTEIATSSVVVDKAAATLAWPGVDGRELRDRVTATASDGNIVKISGTAEDPERAQRLADQVAQQFVAFAARVAGESTDPDAAAQPEELRRLVVQIGRRITELADATDPGRTVESVQTRTELAKLRTSLQEAVNKLDQTGPAADKANMVVMGPAPRPDGQAPPTRVQLIVGGALLFLLVSVLGHLAAARMSRRLRTEPEITAALAAPVLGTVDVPGDRTARRSQGRLRRLVGADIRWDVPVSKTAVDEAATHLRYRRVRAKLPPAHALSVLVPEGDATARRAADQLAAEAGTDPVLRVVDVSMSRPTVPDRDDEAGALIVIGTGDWTAAELTGLAEACADAGHPVVGVVLTDRVRARAHRSADRPRETATVGGAP
ncbi:Wzz/FepE/Etk N-terminal domain-containing protein [Streptomyces sp. NPDC004539]|uniref:Wzz/FepE/Etk N-terminal domain-containing protein n=1 Tax=Streptomyces sp. NPDC004539 TaxID=3154280 RepID=UPI0033AD7712